MELLLLLSPSRASFQICTICTPCIGAHIKRAIFSVKRSPSHRGRLDLIASPHPLQKAEWSGPGDWTAYVRAGDRPARARLRGARPCACASHLDVHSRYTRISRPVGQITRRACACTGCRSADVELRREIRRREIRCLPCRIGSIEGRDRMKRRSRRKHFRGGANDTQKEHTRGFHQWVHLTAQLMLKLAMYS